MWIIPICIVFSFATSIVTTKILAEHYFKIMNQYVDSMCDSTKEFVDEVKTAIKKEN